MVNKDKLIAVLNKLNVHTVYTKDGHFTWKGEIPEGVELVAPFKNTFISGKNIAKWIRRVEACDCVVTESVSKEPSLDDMTKKELDEYASEKYGVELDRRKTKSDMIAQFKELI